MQANICTVSNAKVKQIFQYDDGTIFLVFDRGTDCGCPQKHRVGFHKNDNEQFFVAAAMTALTTGQLVSIRAEDSGCSVHGNSAKLKALYLQSRY